MARGFELSEWHLVETKSLERVLCPFSPCVRSSYAILTHGYAILDKPWGLLSIAYHFAQSKFEGCMIILENTKVVGNGYYLLSGGCLCQKEIMLDCKMNILT